MNKIIDEHLNQSHSGIEQEVKLQIREALQKYDEEHRKLYSSEGSMIIKMKGYEADV